MMRLILLMVLIGDAAAHNRLLLMLRKRRVRVKSVRHHRLLYKEFNLAVREVARLFVREQILKPILGIFWPI